MSLKKDPITFRLSSDDPEIRGYYSFEGEKVAEPVTAIMCKEGQPTTPHVYQKDLVLSVHEWKSGCYVKFEVEIYYSRHVILGEELLDLSGKKTVARRVFYDRDYPQFRVDMVNLQTGDVRGRAEEDTIHKLFWALCVPSAEFRRHFPHLLEFYRETNLVKSDAV